MVVFHSGQEVVLLVQTGKVASYAIITVYTSPVGHFITPSKHWTSLSIWRDGLSFIWTWISLKHQSDSIPIRGHQFILNSSFGWYSLHLFALSNISFRPWLCFRACWTSAWFLTSPSTSHWGSAVKAWCRNGWFSLVVSWLPSATFQCRREIWGLTQSNTSGFWHDNPRYGMPFAIFISIFEPLYYALSMWLTRSFPQASIQSSKVSIVAVQITFVPCLFPQDILKFSPASLS